MLRAAHSVLMHQAAISGKDRLLHCVVEKASSRTDMLTASFGCIWKHRAMTHRSWPRKKVTPLLLWLHLGNTFTVDGQEC